MSTSILKLYSSDLCYVSTQEVRNQVSVLKNTIPLGIMSFSLVKVPRRFGGSPSRSKSKVCLRSVSYWVIASLIIRP